MFSAGKWLIQGSQRMKAHSRRPCAVDRNPAESLNGFASRGNLPKRSRGEVQRSENHDSNYPA